MPLARSVSDCVSLVNNYRHVQPSRPLTSLRLESASGLFLWSTAFVRGIVPDACNCLSDSLGFIMASRDT